MVVLNYCVIVESDFKLVSDFGYDAPTLDAVSYTHLRAHETVLDLVCRLLLEKKKNHNQRQQ